MPGRFLLKLQLERRELVELLLPVACTEPVRRKQHAAPEQVLQNCPERGLVQLLALDSIRERSSALRLPAFEEQAVLRAPDVMGPILAAWLLPLVQRRVWTRCARGGVLRFLQYHAGLPSSVCIRRIRRHRLETRTRVRAAFPSV